MKKEVFLAIAIGFAVGLIITFGIWTANKSLAGIKTDRTPTPAPTGVITDSPGTTTPTPVQALLTLTAPEDELLTNKNSVTLSGKATPAATVVVTYENNEQVLVADASGNFSAEISLIAGYNTILVSAFDTAGNQSSQSLTVTYSTAVI